MKYTLNLNRQQSAPTHNRVLQFKVMQVWSGPCMLLQFFVMGLEDLSCTTLYLQGGSSCLLCAC
jgi:hypothetical protein